MLRPFRFYPPTADRGQRGSGPTPISPPKAGEPTGRSRLEGMTEPSTISTDYPLKQGWFACRSEACGEESFPARPPVIYLNNAQTWTVPCPTCGAEAEELWHSIGAREALGKQTGPRTAEGKARLTGPTTAEGKFKVSANAYLHGAHARRHIVPPAKPGEYAECEECPVRVECEDEVAAAAGTGRFVPCTTIMNLQEKFLHAAIAGSPERLKEIQGLTVAKVQRILFQMIERVLAIGVTQKRLTKYGKDTVIEEEVANPLLKPLNDFIKTLGLDLASWRMTPAAQESSEVPGALPPGTGLQALEDALAHLGDLPDMFDRVRQRIAERTASGGEDGSGDGSPQAEEPVDG